MTTSLTIVGGAAIGMLAGSLLVPFTRRALTASVTRSSTREVGELALATAPSSTNAPAIETPTAVVAPRITPRGRRGEDINALLDKISRHGLDSLTSDERQLLEEASRRLRGAE